MPEEHFYHYRVLESPRHIRLLHANHSDVPSFEIIHVCIDAAPEFEAISYVWGPSIFDHRLSLNEMSVLYVTESLAEALPRLSQLSKTKRLWIDQICIDQGNISERNQQVRIMGQIYEKALYTLIWNGETNPVPQDMSQFLTAISDDAIWSMPFSELSLRKQLQAQMARQSTSTVERLFAFFKRPWFTRVWIYQEAVLSKRPYFVIGDCLVPLAAMFYMLPLPNVGSVRLYRGNNYARLGAMISMRHERETGFERPFHEVLINGAIVAECSNPKDLVYGLLGVLSDSRIKIEPNYALSFEEVAIDAATAIIKGLQKLDIFAVVRHRKTMETLPSWVPAWGSSSDIGPMYPTNPHQQSDTRPNASQGRSHNWKTAEAKTDLIVHGKIIGYVNAVLPHFDRPSSENWRKTYVPYFLDLEALCQTLKETGVCSDEQYSPRRLLSVCLADNPLNPKLQEELHQFPDVINWGDGDALFIGYEKFKVSASQPVPPPRTVDEAYYRVLQELSTVADKRCVFVCDDGKLGLSRRVGVRDVVCILHGCTTPVILRTIDNGRYTLVDICYLEGAMAGEAMDWDVEEGTEIVII
jgi:hypothetical protein